MRNKIPQPSFRKVPKFLHWTAPVVFFLMGIVMSNPKSRRSPASYPAATNESHSLHVPHAHPAKTIKNYPWNGGKQRPPVSWTSDDMRIFDLATPIQLMGTLSIEEPADQLRVVARLIGPLHWKSTSRLETVIPTERESEEQFRFAIPDLEFHEEGKGFVVLDISYISSGQLREVHLPKSLLSSKAPEETSMIPLGKMVDLPEKPQRTNTRFIALPTKPQG